MKKITLLCMGIALAAAPALSFAQSGSGADIFVGGGVGLSAASKDVGTGLGFGLDAGWYFNPNIGVGAFLKSGSHDNGVASFLFGGEVLFRLPDLAPGFSLAAEIADVKFSGSAFSGDYNLGGGGKLAYDYQFASIQPVTVGAELGLLAVKPLNDTLTIFTAAVTMKFWFK